MFGAGIWYILRLMAQPPQPGEPEPRDASRSARAGITPSPAMPARRRGAGHALIDLTVVWAFIIAFAVAAYVVMDGFDLGIGILFPRFARRRRSATRR